MSRIIGAIYVETFICNDKIKKFVEQQLLEYVPPSNLGEFRVNLFVNAMDGFNHTSPNCQNLYQSCVVLTIVSDPQDIKIDEAVDLYYSFVEYIENTLGYEIKNHTYSIT